MKRAGYFLVVLILVIPAFFPSGSTLDENNNSEIISSGQYGKGYRYNIQGWVYLHIEGDPYERGYQYGYLASAEIIEMIQRWANFAKKVEFMKYFILKNRPDRHEELVQKWWDICRTRSMNIFLKQVPEEYVDEMRGMTDGIKARNGKIFGREIEFEDIVASQFVQEVQVTLDNIRKGIHPIRGFLDGLKDLITGDILNPDGHCNAFIATGDATSDGRIVAAHATIFPNYIAERCNFIVDIQPSDGYRFVMTCPPGSLWSQEDWYQNDQGIILTETEISPQGPWKIRRTTPKGVRSRTAIQYSKTIDEVVTNLEKGNNGLIQNEWLIGDKKTDEIASYEQGLYTQNFKQTDTGYYWSCNVAHKTNLLVEITGLPRFIFKIYEILTRGEGVLKLDGEDVIYNDGRCKKLMELGELYHGEIDTDIAKKIMATPPLPNLITDCKITSSRLTENMGLIAIMGKANGVTYIPNEKTLNDFPGVTELPPSGWVEIFPSNSQLSDLPQNNDLNTQEVNSKTLWKYQTNGEGNINYSSSIVFEDIVYTATTTGSIYAFESNNGKQKWRKNIADTALEPAISNNLVFLGTDKGLHAIDKENGNIIWKQLVGKISSKPVITGSYVIVGCNNGEIYVFDVVTGNKERYYAFSDSAYISELNGNNIFYVGSGKTCYAFDIKNEKKLWEFETNGLITSAPRMKKNTLYFGSWDGNIYALDSTTGDMKWSFETGWGVDSTPDVSDGVVFVGSLDNNFYALDTETGKPVWYYNCKSAIHSNPVAYGEYVFFGCDDGRLYALNQKDGALAWSFAPGYSITDDNVNNYITTPIVSNPFVDDGVVYFGAKGTVYALDAQTFEEPKVVKEEPFKIDLNLLLIIFSIIVIVLLVIILLALKYKKKNGMQNE